MPSVLGPVGFITAPGATGNQTYTLPTGTGDVKAILLWWTEQAADGSATHAKFSAGMGTYRGSVVQQLFGAISSQSGTTSEVAASEFNTNAIAVLQDEGTTTRDGEITLVSLGTDQFVLNWTNIPTTGSVLLNFMVICGGSEISDAFVGTFTTANATGQVDVALPAGFGKPDLILALYPAGPDVNAGDPWGVQAAFSAIGMGACIKDGAQFASTWMTDDGSGSMDVGTEEISGSLVRQFDDSDPSVIQADFQVVASTGWPTDGFRIDRVIQQVTTVGFLALKGTFNKSLTQRSTPTAAAPQNSDQALGFSNGKVALLWGGNKNTAGSSAQVGAVADNAQWWIGAYDSIGNNVWAAISQDQSNSSSNSFSYRKSDKTIQMHAAAVPTLRLEGVGSFNASDSRIAFSTTNATARSYLCLVIGYTASGPTTYTKTGLIASECKALGPDVTTHTETGSVISEAKALGPDVSTHVETGMIKVGAVGGVRESITMAVGNQLGDSSLYIPGKGIYFASSTTPDKLIQIPDPNDLTTRNVVTWASDGKHNGTLQQTMFYASAIGKILVTFSGYLDISDNPRVLIAQVDPDTISTNSTWIDFILGTPASSESLGNIGITGTDGTYIWVCSKSGSSNSQIARIRISDGTVMNSIRITGTDHVRMHAFKYDPATNRLYFGGSKISAPKLAWCGWAEADLSAHATLDLDTASGLSDDIEFDGAYFFLNVENETTPTGIVRKIAKDLSSNTTYSMSAGAVDIDGMYHDGTNIWVAPGTTPGGLKKFSPTTGTILATIPLLSGETNINEIVGFGDSLVLASFDSPSDLLRIPLVDANGAVLSGSQAKEKPRTGIVISDRVLSGPDVSTHAETGAVVSAAAASGGKNVVLNRTGSIISPLVASGPDVSTHSETGSVISAAVASGSDAKEKPRTGIVISEAKPSGADVTTHAETGALVSPAVVSGGDASAHDRTGAVVSEAKTSGADVSTFSETGAVIAAAQPSGADVTTHAESGAVISAAVASGASAKQIGGRTGNIQSEAKASGADQFTSTETGAVISPASASGADVTSHAETGAVISDAAISGADVSSHAETGAVISDAIASGADVSSHVETGAIISAAQPSGSSVKLAPGKQGQITSEAKTSAADQFTASETGAVISAASAAGGDATAFNRKNIVISDAVVSGADASTHSETGAVISTAVAAGADQTTHSETGAVISAAQPSGADVASHAESGAITSEAKASGSDSEVRNKTGQITTTGVLAGIQQHVIGRAGQIIGEWIGSASDQVTFTEAGKIVSEGVVIGSFAKVGGKEGKIVMALVLSGKTPKRATIGPNAEVVLVSAASTAELIQADYEESEILDTDLEEPHGLSASTFYPS